MATKNQSATVYLGVPLTREEYQRVEALAERNRRSKGAQAAYMIQSQLPIAEGKRP